MGANALINNKVQNNIAIGTNGLYNNSTGQNNLSIGNNCLYNNTTSSNNTVIGNLALFGFSGPIGNNVAIGFKSLFKTQVDNLTAVGTYSLENNTVGTYNTAVGFGDASKE